MSRTYVIQGGTDGIGAALARALFARGDHAIVLGTDARKGALLLAEAADAPGGASFVQADLALVANNRRVAAELAEAHPVIDGLVLCARFFRSRRAVTADGFEDNFALFYLSRLLLGEGLRAPLERAARPVIVNAAGPGHPTPIDWADLQSAHAYDGVRAMFLTGRLNDLLGVTFAERHGDRIAYVLFHPGTTATGFRGAYDAPTARFIEQQKALAKPATDVVPPLLRLLDAPPAAPLSAFHLDAPLPLRPDLFAPADAARLAELTDALLREIPARGPRSTPRDDGPPAV
ncbi:SDR family NAD(P)-dependent oxidoreductase [Streptomyces avicenniae]|uniref:SDR family NAD(P)-dependent oxidoreductase n=1 Tax=Streptomyces avicenniae TaxID=500153 RepID=UPI000699C804|nr:SDR family NAD(P)-dependent oxidoreductase [Streptomyces avicenniae]